MACDANINNRLSEKKPNLSVCYGDAYGENQENIIKKYILLEIALYEKFLNSKSLQKEINSKIKELQQNEVEEIEKIRKNLLNETKKTFFIKYESIEVHEHTEGIDIYYKKSTNIKGKKIKSTISLKYLKDLDIKEYKNLQDLNNKLIDKLTNNELTSAQINNVSKIIELLTLYLEK